MSEEKIQEVKDGYEEVLDEKITAALLLTDQIIGASRPLEKKNTVLIKRNLTREERAEISLGVGLFMGMSKVLIALGLEPEEMETINIVVVGAEKMPQRLADAFKEKFGLQPMEAYGCTECSPGVSVNIPDMTVEGQVQSGSRQGTIGRALPGISVKIVDPDTEKLCDFDSSGLMWVKGPNIMKGYIGKEDLTKEVLVDGWYNTGDIASISDDGFITITDRLSRFSKIGGEMVPHIKVEELLHSIAEITEQTFAVTGLPDEKKGERLVVLHLMDEQGLEKVYEEFAESDIPNLWKPRKEQFLRVDELPYLGTGKLDLKAIKTIAQEMTSN